MAVPGREGPEGPLRFGVHRRQRRGPSAAVFLCRAGAAGAAARRSNPASAVAQLDPAQLDPGLATPGSASGLRVGDERWLPCFVFVKCMYPLSRSWANRRSARVRLASPQVRPGNSVRQFRPRFVPTFRQFGNSVPGSFDGLVRSMAWCGGDDVGAILLFACAGDLTSAQYFDTAQETVRRVERGPTVGHFRGPPVAGRLQFGLRPPGRIRSRS